MKESKLLPRFHADTHRAGLSVNSCPVEKQSRHQEGQKQVVNPRVLITDHCLIRISKLTDCAIVAINYIFCFMTVSSEGAVRITAQS